MSTKPNPLAVFINCPFDDRYKPFFDIIVFTILRCGFVPRCALEADNAGENRFQKILAIMMDCRLSIHDICRTESDGDPPLPRFNMPFELGLFLGLMHQPGHRRLRRSCVIFDRDRYRYQRFLSDIAGQDIKSHDNNELTLVRELTAWLRDHADGRQVPGAAAVERDMHLFPEFVALTLQELELDYNDLTFNDHVNMIRMYLSSG